jgi:predicted nucleotide-binding protein (sugar kinase/HSP70/actin superfamily)
MNKGIPQIFARLGIKVFFQDMLTISDEDELPLRDLLGRFQWYFAKEILQAAENVARSPSAYPVLITSFKCSPDAFAIEYFKELMEAHQKPYLVLQLDEHDSRVGYETRIEAALDSFRNHFMSLSEGRRDPVHYPSSLQPAREPKLEGKTLLIPNWDNLTLSLVVANLCREGIDARLLRGSPRKIQKGLRHNSGQCTPLSILAQEFIDYVRENDLDPAKSLLWIPESSISCNICMFPHYIRKTLQSCGGRMAQANVYIGTLSFMDLSIRLPINIYFAHMFGGFLRKMACRVRPYEKERGSADRAVSEGIRIFQEAVLENRGKEEAVKQVVSLFRAIRTQFTARPKVAIFGDLYVRDNALVNQGLVHFIEDHGGEVVTTPYSAFVKMVSAPYLRKWVVEGDLLGALSSKALLAMVSRLERTYLRYFHEVLGDTEPQFNDSAEEILSEHKVRLEHTGESMENLLKIHYLKKHYPDIALFVQTSPAFCCPSLVTEAMARKIERSTGVPIVSITYDGTGGDKNQAVIPYLKCKKPGNLSELHQSSGYFRRFSTPQKG